MPVPESFVSSQLTLKGIKFLLCSRDRNRRVQQLEWEMKRYRRYSDCFSEERHIGSTDEVIEGGVGLDVQEKRMKT